MQSNKSKEIKDFEEDCRIIANRLSSRYTTSIIFKMKEKGLKIQDLADLLHIKKKKLIKIFHNQNMTFEEAAQLAKILGLEFSVYLDGDQIKADLM